MAWLAAMIGVKLQVVGGYEHYVSIYYEIISVPAADTSQKMSQGTPLTCARTAVQYPPLALLPAAARVTLSSKLPPTTELSFLQWCRNFKVEASLSASSGNGSARAGGDRIEAITGTMQDAKV